MSRARTVEGLAVDIRRAATPKGRAEVGADVIEGTRLFERALRAGAEIVAAIHADDYSSRDEPRQASIIADLVSRSTELFSLPIHEMTELTAGRKFGAIVGLVRIPVKEDLNDILANASPQSRILAAIEVEDPGNVGALMRTALASGALALLTTGVSDPYHPRAIRTSMGAVFRLPLIEMKTTKVVASLHDSGLQTAATVATGGEDIRTFVWPPSPLAILMGSEAHSLPEEIIREASYRVSIPMADNIDSFSVNAAAAIVLHQATHCAEEPRPVDPK